MTVSTYDFSGAVGDVTSPFAGIGDTVNSTNMLHRTGTGVCQTSHPVYQSSYDGTTLGANVYSKIKFVGMDTGTFDSTIIVNMALRATAGGNGYELQWHGFDGKIYFYRITGWVETSIGTAVTKLGSSYTANDILEARMSGGILSAYVNGVLVGSSGSDTTYTAAGRSVLSLYCNGAVASFDDWETGDLGGGGGSVAGLRRSLLGCG